MRRRLARPLSRPLARTLAAVLASAALLTATACSGQSDGKDGEGDANAPKPGTLRVLASSELSDMTPVFERVEKDTGVTLRPTYMGTLDAVDLLATGKADGRYDAVWLSSNDYLRLRPDAAKKVVSETPSCPAPSPSASGPPRSASWAGSRRRSPGRRSTRRSRTAGSPTA